MPETKTRNVFEVIKPTCLGDKSKQLWEAKSLLAKKFYESSKYNELYNCTNKAERDCHNDKSLWCRDVERSEKLFVFVL